MDSRNIISNLIAVVLVNFFHVAANQQGQKVLDPNSDGIDYCEIFCGDNGTFVHTACELAERPICDRYKKFNLFAVTGMSDGAVLNLLVEGHNGLRDRIANKMSVANMVKLSWDQSLAEMASLYFERCTPDVDDPCTKFISDDLDCVELLEYKEVEENNYLYISQNRFKERADFFPRYFIETALRTWYYDKNQMIKPRYNRSIYQGSTIGVISEETNFTHLAAPLTAHFGCAIAQIDHYFEIICNYFPYYRLPDFETIFVNGTPATQCPSFYPIASESLVSLCCDGHEIEDNLISLSSKLMPTAVCLLLIALVEFLQH